MTVADVRNAAVAVHLDVDAPVAVHFRARRLTVGVMRRGTGMRREMRTLAPMTRMRIRRMRTLATVPAG